MMRSGLFIFTALASIIGGGTAQATVKVAIDLSHQRMHVTSARGSYDWPVSTARSGFSTPGGSFAPTRLELMHYSKKYDMAPMPHAIFFRGGYAIHGTDAVGSLGRPASHGCVRLSPGHAAALYAMVQEEGARISISGRPPAARPFGTVYARRATPERFAHRRFREDRDGYAAGTYMDQPYARYYGYLPAYGGAPAGLPMQQAPMEGYYGE